MKLKIFCFVFVAANVLASFSAHADATVTTLVAFTGTNGPNLGANPYAELVQGSDGNFYGTTAAGGSNNLGTVFCMTPRGVLTTLVSFSGTNGPNLGANCRSGLIQVGNAFYGVTRSGGSNNLGTVFGITTNGFLTTLATFKGSNGSAPLTGLLLASDGNLYGTTSTGGVYNKGTIFQVTTNGALNVLVSFPGGTGGNAPEAGLIQGMDGYLYGTTWAGGNLFLATTTGQITNLVVFPTGAQPRGKLVQDAAGILYGTTFGNGAYGYGTAFKVTTGGALTTLYNFDNTNAAEPYAGMIFGKDGNLYGAAQLGGAHTVGALFQITTNVNFYLLYSFDFYPTNSTYVFPHGEQPYAELVQGTDGDFYGTAEIGGAAGFGTIFKMSLRPVFQSVIQTNHLIKFSWNAISNKTYQLSYKTNFSASNWQNLGSSFAATNGTMTTSDNPGTDTQRFYRLQLLP